MTRVDGTAEENPYVPSTHESKGKCIVTLPRERRDRVANGLGEATDIHSL